jgi:NADH dehydrogenase
VVIVGGGFGGLRAARALRDAPVEVVLVDRRNFHLFQPLLYQVATGALSPGEISAPLRGVLRRQANARVVLAEVRDVDLRGRRLLLAPPVADAPERWLAYDALILATGSSHSYFGHDEWRAVAPGLKSLEDALELRRRILTAFEAAESEPDPGRRRAWLTFAVVGAGPTGVELAGQIAEIARDTVVRDFRSIDPRSARILLVEAAPRVLGAFPESLGLAARRSLEEMGVEVLLGTSVVDVDPACVVVADGDGRREIPVRTVIWAAGVAASPLARRVGELSGAEVDRAGRVHVDERLALPGHPEVLVVGDMARVVPPGRDAPLPGVAPVAMQQGVYAAGAVAARLEGRTPPPFRYREKGNLATIGRARAVADIRGLRFTGLAAWVTWLVVHLMYLIGFQNRVLVVVRWTFSYITRGRGARLITGPKTADGLATAGGPDGGATASVGDTAEAQPAGR